jgi:hypothetical protein
MSFSFESEADLAEKSSFFQAALYKRLLCDQGLATTTFRSISSSLSSGISGYSRARILRSRSWLRVFTVRMHNLFPCKGGMPSPNYGNTATPRRTMPFCGRSRLSTRGFLYWESRANMSQCWFLPLATAVVLSRVLL